MNYWASGVDPAGKPAQGFRYGTLFDSSADKLNQLMLFTDVIGKLPTTDGWVTVGRFGMFGKPGERFGGPRSGAPRYFDDYLHAVVRRFKSAVATDLDYSRHGTNDKRWLAEGAVNIAYADAHVALKQHTDLYELESKRSTYETLWSPMDQEIEEELIRNPLDSPYPEWGPRGEVNGP